MKSNIFQEKNLAICGILIGLLPIISTNTIPDQCQTTRQDLKCRQLHGPNYWDYNEECKTPKEICPNMYTHFDRCDNSQPCKPCDRQWWNPYYQLTCTKRRVSPDLVPKTKKNATEATIPLFNSTLAPGTENTSSHNVTTGSPMPPYIFEERINTTLNPQLADNVTVNESNPKQIAATIPIPGGHSITPAIGIGIVSFIVCCLLFIVCCLLFYIWRLKRATAKSSGSKVTDEQRASDEDPGSEESMLSSRS